MKLKPVPSPTRLPVMSLLGLLLLLVFAPDCMGRMGGGHSYSSGDFGGSSHSGGGNWSGGGSGGGDFRGSVPYGGYSRQPGIAINPYGTYPNASNPDRWTQAVEIVLLTCLIYVLLRLMTKGGRSTSPTRVYQYGYPGDFAGTTDRLDATLENLKIRDENFSKVLFLDFASLLYHKFYTFRGSGQFRLLSPFLSHPIYDQTNRHAFYPQQRVDQIVIGKACIKEILDVDGQDQARVEFESNFTLQYLATGNSVRYVTREQWSFRRRGGAVSPEPGQMRALSCPSCGAPADFTDAGECQYCHSFIQAGEKQWQVAKIDVISRQPFQIESPAAYQPEMGTNLPTIKQAGLDTLRQTFSRTHGVDDWAEFFSGFIGKVAKPYFLATYSAWSGGDWKKARHLVSDRLYESNGFWMQEYARSGWRNLLENIQIQGVELARIDLDKFYESLTVRIFASCLDYTVDRQGRLIGGSKRISRAFSEYWTFVRTTGTEKVEDEYDVDTCPACGAPADKVGQAGICEYCGSKISDGDFSWVLAAITQDEVYEG